MPKDLRNDPGLIYERARLLRRKDKFAEAADLLDPPPQNVPRPDLLWSELKRAARGSLEDGNISAAYRLAAAHGTDNGEAFAEGEFLAGWIALRFLDDAPTAMKHFTAIYAGTTSIISQSRGAYWAGRAAEQMGDVAKAPGLVQGGVQGHHQLLRPGGGVAPWPTSARSTWPARRSRRPRKSRSSTRRSWCGWCAC